MTRVQIPAYTDHWMRGDRYGEIVRVTRVAVHQPLPSAPPTLEESLTPLDIASHTREIAHVRLDKSGKVARVYLDDCTVL
jgi:hypothetical protein